MIGFHKVLIGTAIVFFLMFAILEGILYLTQDGGTLALALAVGSAAATAALTFYLLNLRRFVGRPDGRSGPGRQDGA